MLVVFYVLLTVQLGIIFVNNQLDAQFFFTYVYFCSIHVSGSHVPIIRRINRINRTFRAAMCPSSRRINCINRASGLCHSVQMTVWCADVHTCTPNGPLYRVTYTRCPIDTINFPINGHMAARNM